jgi:hypothetical protein
MTLPTREQLNHEVDRRFFAANPGAPARLDPDDPSHAALVNDWLERRDDLLNEWVGDVFRRFYPDAGRLDPNDSNDAQLIEFWLDIRDAIRDGTPPRYNWDADPTVAGDVTTSDAGNDRATPPVPDIDEYDRLAGVLKANLRALQEINSMAADSDASRHLAHWLDIGRSMYHGAYFATHDEWTSPTQNFDGGTGFTDFGVQIRVVGTDRALRMGMVGTGPSDVGGWERYNGAPTN